jgi:hypothetical protein
VLAPQLSTFELAQQPSLSSKELALQPFSQLALQ